MPRHPIPPQKRRAIINTYRRLRQIQATATHHKVSHMTVRRVLKDAGVPTPTQLSKEYEEPIPAGEVKDPLQEYMDRRTPPPPEPDTARRDHALEDFEFFFTSYIAPSERHFTKYCPDGKLPAFQIEMTATITEGKRWHLFTIAPGHGKTLTMLSWVLWQICRDRDTKVMFITKSERMAKTRLAWLKQHMTRNQDLIRDFGRFKPDTDDDEMSWTKSEVTVAGGTATAKDPTIAVYGAGQQIYGARVNIIVADDVVDKKSFTDKTDRQALQDWWDTEVESRLEPEGVGAVAGTRLGPNDLYGHLGTKTDDAGNKVYRWTKYKAHDLAKCPGDEHLAYPEGCLLFPTRWSLDKLNNGVHRGPTWALTYQQEDVPADDVLVERAWIFGGPDSIGWDAPGCLDHHRSLGQIPLAAGPTVSVITIDPSPTRWWAVHFWLVEPGNPSTWHLYKTLSRKMSSADLLDFNAQGQPTGLLEQWRQEAAQAHRPIRHIILEFNAAQRWILESFNHRRWAQAWGILLQPHTTTSNKADPRLGVWGIGSRFREGKVRLPYQTAQDRLDLARYVSELTNYPYADDDDTVMSTWMLFYNERRIRFPAPVATFDPSVPSWVQGRGSVELSSGRREAFQDVQSLR